MKIALLSDIHGNAVALEAVLRDIDAEGVDLIICLGDVATLESSELPIRSWWIEQYNAFLARR